MKKNSPSKCQFPRAAGIISVAHRVVNQYQLYKPRKISFREIKMECMHDESANRLPGTIIRRAGNRPSQATLHEIWIFIYPPFKKHLGFRETASCSSSKVSSSFYKKRMAEIRVLWREAQWRKARTAGRRLGSKVFRERPIHAKTVYIMIHWTAKQAPRIVRRYGRNMWGNRMVILCETNCSANSCSSPCLGRGEKELG